jgi:aspartate-semialdehyde dehydrogenase
MSKRYNVAVVGATGNVGRTMLEVLSERNFPVNEVFAVASKNSAGKEVSFGDTKRLIVKDLESFDFTGIDIAFFSPGSSISKIHAPRAAAAGCVVVDNTSCFRYDADVPLVVPEVNAHALSDYKTRKIIANPNCSTIQMVVALKPLHELFGIKRVVVSTYQSVSGAGKEGMDELYNQTKGIFEARGVEPQKFTKQIAFNVIPHIDVFMDDGFTKEEWKMRIETKKILDEKIEVVASCVRVPVFVGHAEAINVEFEKPVDFDAAYKALTKADGVVVYDRRENEGYATPLDVVGDDATYVSRLRLDPSVPDNRGLVMWVVADNVRKGAATNAVQIGEALIKDFGL